MTILVGVCGVAIGAICLCGLAYPPGVFRLVEALPSRPRFFTAVGVRIGMGVACLMAAPAARSPLTLQILGGIALAAAIGLLAMGRGRLDRLIAWWKTCPAWVVRLGCLIGVLVGGVMVWAAGLLPGPL